jgi:hypothetical protein
MQELGPPSPVSATKASMKASRPINLSHTAWKTNHGFNTPAFKTFREHAEERTSMLFKGINIQLGGKSLFYPAQKVIISAKIYLANWHCLYMVSGPADRGAINSWLSESSIWSKEEAIQVYIYPTSTSTNQPTLKKGRSRLLCT